MMKWSQTNVWNQRRRTGQRQTEPVEGADTGVRMEPGNWGEPAEGTQPESWVDSAQTKELEDWAGSVETKELRGWTEPLEVEGLKKPEAICEFNIPDGTSGFKYISWVGLHVKMSN